MNDQHLDRIFIRDLSCRCIVGINPDERTKKQEVIINIVMYADLRPACASDDIADTIDYKKIKRAVLDMAEQSSYSLIERLAEHIAAICLEETAVRRVLVSVDKPGALRFTRSVAVEIVRER